MPVIKSKKRGLKIFLIVLGTLILVVSISFALFFIPWIKEKAIRYVENNSEYKLKINTVVFTSFHSLEITGIELRPKLDIKQFYQSNNTERDWISAKAHLSLNGIHWKESLWHKKIHVDTMIIKEVNIYVYHDKKMPDAAYKYKPLHSQILRNANISVTVPLIEIVKAKISYEENPDVGSSGTIFFTKLYASIHNISTDSIYMHQHPEVVVNGKGLIFDSIKARMRYTFSALDKRDRFTFEGHTGAFSSDVLNKCITPMTHVTIRSGHVEKTDLFFTADDHMANGVLDIDYNHLKIDILNKHGKKSLIKSFVSHLLINKDDKKSNGKEKEAGKIMAERNTGSSVFNYWWLAIKSGLVSSVVKVPVHPKDKDKEDKHSDHHEKKHHHVKNKT